MARERTSSSILLVSAEHAGLGELIERLTKPGQSVIRTMNLKAARQELAGGVDVLCVARCLPDGSGLQLLDEARASACEIPIIVLDEEASTRRAVEAMKAGAFHYLEWARVSELGDIVDSARERRSMLRAVQDIRRLRRSLDGDGHIIGRSRRMRRVRNLLERISSSPGSTVLITGESGTGKDLAARYIHFHSHRAAKPFLNITCSALPSTLLESELFGYERGAFTDAKQRKLGLLEDAAGGTVFLDEIGEMELSLQAKLLRVLEDKSFRRVGGSGDIRADIRVVAATNVDLREAVKSGTFREDLYYRLAVLMVETPALRDREDDSVHLALFFLDRFNREFDREVEGFTRDALEWIRAYPWPGNVRELKNAVERAVLLTTSTLIDRDDLTSVTVAGVERDAISLPAGGVDMRELEKTLVQQALERTGGNRTRAGRLLGMNRDQIRYRIEQYQLQEYASS